MLPIRSPAFAWCGGQTFFAMLEMVSKKFGQMAIATEDFLSQSVNLL
jgi:hypothetical protein